MTGWKALRQRAQLQFDGLMWGFEDLKRMLAEHGWWPAKSKSVISSDGSRWFIVGGAAVSKINTTPPICLAIAEEQCLWGSAQFPPMRREALRIAVQETLWRQSPFPPEKIISAFRCEPMKGGGWEVHWGLCRRSVQQDLQRSQSLQTDSATYLLRQGRAYMVNGSSAQRNVRVGQMLNALMLIALLVLILALLAPALVPLALKRQAVVDAMQQMVSLEPRTAPLRQKLDSLRRQTRLSDQLVLAVATAIPYASVVDSLSSVLPDDAWLDRIEINGDEIRITGLTTNATDLLAQMGRSPSIANVRATAPSVRDGALNKERFTFEMRWVGGGRT
jgi:general secretion pathway protein L